MAHDFEGREAVSAGLSAPAPDPALAAPQPCPASGHRPRFMALDFLKYIGPGLLVTVGFIDPGNWASNVAAGAGFGYELLWMVTLSTLMLIILQHNAAHLGIATGLCMSEAATCHFPRWLAHVLLATAMLAAVATALAELLGGAIALGMLFDLPLWLGTLLIFGFSAYLLFSNSYRRIERAIIGFVSLIGLSFVLELVLVPVDWTRAAVGWVTPGLPEGSLPVVMSVLGAVVMPHNLFLHSEVIQSRQWQLTDEATIRTQLRYEFADTLFSMVVGWAINSAMIILAAATFFKAGQEVSALEQAQSMLGPLAGRLASLVFAVALLFSGVASSVTAGMAGGAIFAGIFHEPYDMADRHTKWGVALTLVLAALGIFFIKDAFQGLLYSQMALSVQLPLTIFLLIFLTSSGKVMGRYRNPPFTTAVLSLVAAVVVYLNVMLVLNG